MKRKSSCNVRHVDIDATYTLCYTPFTYVIQSFSFDGQA